MMLNYVNNLFKILGWKKLDVQQKIQTATMVYKSLNGLAPEYLRSKFSHHSDILSYTPRDCEDKLAIPLPRTNFLKSSFSYSGAVLWNSLPVRLWQAQTLSSFTFGCSGSLITMVNYSLYTAFMESRYLLVHITPLILIRNE